jgi:hypothetical protein
MSDPIVPTIIAHFLMALLVHEAPAIQRKPEAALAWQNEIAAAVELDARVASAGLLVSPEVDAAILDATRWYEARMKSRPKDGDCTLAPIPNSQKWDKVCPAIGPLQLHPSALRALRDTPEAASAGLAAGHVPPDALRDPETGVRAGYAGLMRWKKLCGGSPALWFTAWGWGRCPPKKTTIDREGVRRCALVTILLDAQDKRPEGWKCGHEGRKIRDPYDHRFLAWARGQAETRGGLTPPPAPPAEKHIIIRVKP